MDTQRITEQDEVQVGDTLIDRNPVTGREVKVTVTRVTKTRIFVTNGTEFTRDGCNPNDKLMRFRQRLLREKS